MSEVQQYGMVTTFDFFKGFGFIRREKGRDLFFMYTDLVQDEVAIAPGDQVTFYEKIMPKGPRATKVQKIG